MQIQVIVTSFLAIPLVLLPLPTHWRAGNIPTLTIMITLFLINLIRGTNAILWANTVVPRLPVWCDITTKFTVGAQVALPAASLCITRHLASISSLRSTIETSREKWRRKCFEAFLCVGFPCVIMALHYVVQGHRFDIIEDLGCIANTYWSWPSLLVVSIPPLAIAVVSLVYASIAFYWFIRRRHQFQEHLQSHNSGLTSSRYLRLMAMATTEIVIETGLGAWLMAATLQIEYLRDWDNWDDVHSNFSRVAQYPIVLIDPAIWDRMLVTWYITPICSLEFFIFFGLGEEALQEYRAAALWIRTKIFRQKIKPSNDSVLPTISAPRRVARVRADEIDQYSMYSLEDKEHDHDKSERGSTLMNTSVSEVYKSEDLPPRPLSAPPVTPLSPDLGENNGTIRPFSLDLPRRDSTGLYS